MDKATITPRTMSGGLLTKCTQENDTLYFVFKGVFQREDTDEYSNTFKALWDDVLAIYPLSNTINYRFIPSKSKEDLQFLVNSKVAKLTPKEILNIHSLNQLYDFKHFVIKDNSLLMMNLAILSKLASLGVHINLNTVSEDDVAHNQAILTNTLNTLENDLLDRYNEKAIRSSSQLTESVLSVITPSEEKMFSMVSYLVNLLALQRKYINRK